jgi:hypothetical protein
MSEEQSYYDRHKEERRAYQRAYYKEHKQTLRRKQEVEDVLEPEKREQRLSYQRAYYFANRQRLLAARRDRQARKGRGGEQS